MREETCAFCGKPIKGQAFCERSLAGQLRRAFYRHHCGKKYFENLWKIHFRWYGLSQENVPDFYRYVDESLKTAFEEGYCLVFFLLPLAVEYLLLVSGFQ